MFERLVVHAYAIAFQKSVLPHAHCIFFLNKELKDKLNDFEFTYTLTSAAISSKSGRELGEILQKLSIHSSCDNLNLAAVCMLKSNNQEGCASCLKETSKMYSG